MAKSFVTKKTIKASEYNEFTGEYLPQVAQDWADKHEIFKSGHASWLYGTVFYKGDNPETATEWALATDDGSYYKVRAEFMLWFVNDTGILIGRASWTVTSLKRMITALLLNQPIPSDPNYQT